MASGLGKRAVSAFWWESGPRRCLQVSRTETLPVFAPEGQIGRGFGVSWRTGL